MTPARPSAPAIRRRSSWSFFYRLRGHGLKVTPQQWLTVVEALARGLHGSSLIGFYSLARAILVRDESELDDFDVCFAAHFERGGRRGRADRAGGLGVAGEPGPAVRRRPVAASGCSSAWTSTPCARRSSAGSASRPSGTTAATTGSAPAAPPPSATPATTPAASGSAARAAAAPPSRWPPSAATASTAGTWSSTPGSSASPSRSCARSSAPDRPTSSTSTPPSTAPRAAAASSSWSSSRRGRTA